MTLVALLIALGATLVAVHALNRAIRRSLTAPRIVETSTPRDLPWREVRIPTERGRTLFGWYVPAATVAPALAIIHGWGGNAETMLPLAPPLHARGYAVLLIDARCHGRSDDDSFASLPRFAEDLEHAVDWLRLQPDVDVRRIGVVGHSVGAAATLLAASRRHDIAAVVSLAAFAHPALMMRRWLAQKRIPHLPLGAYILFYVQQVIGHRFDDIAPSNTIRRIRCPVLLAHGCDDTTVPPDDARAIHANRAGDNVQLRLIAGSHDEYGDIERDADALADFLDSAMPPGTPTAGKDDPAAPATATLPLIGAMH